MNVDDLSKIEKDYIRVKLPLESLRMDPQARLHYDIMSAALYWHDEIPEEYTGNLWCLRPVLRYRTGLIIGMRFVEYQAKWDLAKAIFPKWIGFLSNRCQRDLQLEEEYWHRSGKRRSAAP